VTSPTRTALRHRPSVVERRRRPSAVEVQLKTELSAAQRHIAALAADLAETSRARDQLRDLLDAMDWHTRWGRSFRSTTRP
jgi:hypothetical protein